MRVAVAAAVSSMDWAHIGQLGLARLTATYSRCCAYADASVVVPTVLCPALPHRRGDLRRVGRPARLSVCQPWNVHFMSFSNACSRATR